LLFLVWISHYLPYCLLAALFSVSTSTIHNILEEFLEIIVIEFSDEIQWPDEQERLELRGKLPGQPMAIGVLDATIHRRQRPGIIQIEAYRGDKKCHFLNTLTVCDYRGVLIFLDTGFLGRSNDQNCYNNSELKKHPEKYFSQGEKLLADGGFHDQYLISPISTARKEKRPVLKSVSLNHSINRIIIENVHAYLKRFRILHYVSRHEIPKQTLIVTATCLLANRQLRKKPLRPEVQVDEFDELIFDDFTFGNIQEADLEEDSEIIDSASDLSDESENDMFD